MSDNTYKPAGYCPHCGYAIDPGVCPECGKNVAADELDSSPYRRIRRKKTKRAILVALIVGIVIGGWYVYARCNWIAWVPSRLLMVVNGGGSSRSNIELWRRFCAGTLSAGQADRLLAVSMRVPKGLVIRNPHPAALDVEIRLEVTESVFVPGWELWCSSRQVSVDGHPASVTNTVPVPDHTTGVSGRSGNRHCMRIPRLPPGSHEIRAALTYELRPYSPVTQQSRSSVRTTLSLSEAVLVEDKPVSAYVREVGEPQVDHSGFFGLRVSSGPWHRPMSVDINNPPIPIAARLECRAGDTSDYQRFLTVSSPAGQRYLWAFSLSQVTNFVPGKTFDLRLVPDIETAWYGGLTTFFGGTVEWSGVPIPSGPDTWVPTWPTTSPSASFLPPTRIYQATATRTSG